MDQSQTDRLREIVKQKPALLWYTRSYDELDNEAIAEAIYNYGTWEEVRQYHDIIGLTQAKSLFTALVQKPRTNLRPIVRNYFTLYYDRHAS